jgi:hypothetical protein
MHYALLMATTKTTTTSKPMCDLNILNNWECIAKSKTCSIYKVNGVLFIQTEERKIKPSSYLKDILKV